jgi:hypothetical protein
MAGKGVQLGFLKYVLGFDSLQFKKGIAQADADLVKMQKSFAAKGKELQSLGKGLTAFVTLPIIGLATAGIKEAQETATAMAQVNASLASMGPVAQRTSKQLQDAANSFETHSLYEADQILKDVTAQMLTFGNISGKTFDQAQQAALDLATKFGKDLGSAAILVGKALNDPVKGLTALQKVGVQFTAGQKEQIKAMVEVGNTAGAQALILKELQREVGGSAEAAQNADPWNKLSDAFKSIAESIGTVLLPIIPPLANALASVANFVAGLDPTTQKWVVGIAAAAAALGPFLIILGNVVVAVSRLGPLVTVLVRGWGLLASAMSVLGPIITVVRVALITLVTNPFLLGFALVLAGIYLAWKNWDKIGPIVKAVYNAIANWLGQKLHAILNALQHPIAAVTGWFHDMYDKVVGHSYVPDMVTGIGEEMRRLDSVMVDKAKDTTKKTGEAFKQLQSDVAALLSRLYPEQAQDNAILKDVQLLNKAFKEGAIQAHTWMDALAQLTGGGVSDDLKNAGNVDQLTSSFKDFELANLDAGDSAKKTGLEVTQAYADMAKNVAGSLQDMVGNIKDKNWLGALQDVLGIVKGVIQSLQQIGAIRTPAGVNSGGSATPRASGGPVVPGRTYLVGEKGPEYMKFGSSGFITPPKDGGGGKVTIVPSQYFDAVVDNRSAAIAAPLAARGAMAGASGAMIGIQRRRERTLPG